MTAHMRILALAMLAVSFSSADTYKYTLPGDSLWPGVADWEGLRTMLSDDAELYTRGGEGYNLTELYSSAVFNRRSGVPQPAAIARPADENDVRNLILFAKSHMMRIAVYNTGHNNDVRNTADNSLLIHTVLLKGVTVDTDAQTAVVGAGATMAELAQTVVITSGGTLVPLMGSVGTVGVWGWTVGGGIGPLTRLYGLGVDALLSVTLVTAEGEIITATADNEHSELLWALKGGSGCAFGIGISMTFQLFPSPGAMRTYLGMYYQTDYVAQAYGAVLEAAPDNAFGYYLVTIPGLTRILAFCFGTTECDDFMAGMAAIESCLYYNPVYCQELVAQFPLGFLAIFQASSLDRRNQWVMGGTANGDLAASYVEVNAWTKNLTESTFYDRQCWGEAVMGGASATMDLDSNLTSVPSGMRQSRQYLICMVEWDDDVAVENQTHAVSTLYNFGDQYLKPRSPNSWVYWNEGQHSYSSDDEWKIRYWGSLERYEQLLNVKLAYDPTNFLTCYHCVGWNFTSSVDPAICPSNECSCSNNPTGACSVYEEDL